jgi:uncharacterized protein (UPF0333 family)
MISNNKAQSTLEYAVIIFVVVAALVGMQIFMKRSFEGKIHVSTDDIGQQFDPGKTTATSFHYRTAKTVQKVANKVTNVYSDGQEGSNAEHIRENSYEEVDAK